MHFIEGGWPGANPKDIEFFERAPRELRIERSALVAFGSTRRPRGKVDDDPTLRNLLDAKTSAVCIVGKSWDYHVTEALRTTLDEGEAMVADSVRFLADAGVRVISWETMMGRHTGTARHLTDPSGKVYTATMEEGFYDNVEKGRTGLSSAEWAQLRDLHIALTRAKDELYLTYPMMNPKSYTGDVICKPSQFLDDFPQDLVEEWNVGNENTWGDDVPF